MRGFTVQAGNSIAVRAREDRDELCDYFNLNGADSGTGTIFQQGCQAPPYPAGGLL